MMDSRSEIAGQGRRGFVKNGVRSDIVKGVVPKLDHRGLSGK